MAETCQGCGFRDAIGELGTDPYDEISSSPILRPVKYCLFCYNRRVISALRWVLRQSRQ